MNAQDSDFVSPLYQAVRVERLELLLCHGAGADPEFTKGGAQIHCSEHDNCVRSMPNLGGMGACPPEKFEKLDPLRLNLRALLMVCYFYY